MPDIGAQYLAAGISSAGKDLGEGIAAWKERRKANKELQAAVEAIGGATEHLVKQGMLPPSALQQYSSAAEGSPEQKRGFLKGLGESLKMMEAAKVEQRAATQEQRSTRYLELQEEAMHRNQEKIAAQARFSQAVGDYLKPQVNARGVTSRALDAGSLARMAGEAGIADPGELGNLFGEQQQNRVRKVREVTSPTGTTYLESDNGQFQIVHPNTLPEGDMEAIEVKDSKGKVVAYGLPNGKGGFIYRSATKEVPPDGSPGPGKLSKTHVWAGGRLVEIKATLDDDEEEPTPVKGGGPIKYDAQGKRLP